jgi:hypothetical protein
MIVGLSRLSIDPDLAGCEHSRERIAIAATGSGKHITNRVTGQLFTPGSGSITRCSKEADDSHST